MIGIGSSVRIYLAAEPTDMRKGPDGLAILVHQNFEEDLFSGHLFAFLSKRCDRVKILWWDHGGFAVYYKRLEQGKFRRPQPDANGNVTMTSAELHSLLEGIDLTTAKRAKLWEPSSRVASAIQP